MTDEPKAISMTIVINGALRDTESQDRLSLFMEHVQKALFETWPEFLPGRPPVTIVWSEVRDDWIKR